MGQVSSVLRRMQGAYGHWCSACEEIHPLPDSWTFVNGDLEKPTFTPSFKHEFFKRIFVDGRWTGEYVRDSEGKPIPVICHYTLTNGQLQFCDDSTHSLAGKLVDMHKLPEGLTDDRF